MSVEAFVDTNVLYYANTDSPDPRHALARERIEPLWIEPGKAAVSVQILQELHLNLMRKAGLAPAESARRVSHYLAWKVIDNDRLLLTSAFDVQVRWQLSYRDSLIVAAAQRAGATQLWSEDMTGGQDYGDVRVINPLRAP
jgi:predicted nucleic acid-binding protein